MTLRLGAGRRFASGYQEAFAMLQRTSESHSSRRSMTRLGVLLLPILLALGCPGGDDPLEEEAGLALPEGTVLRVLVIDDPAMAEQIALLSGTWRSSTGAEIAVESITSEEADAREAVDADAIIAAPHCIGEYDARGWIQEPAPLTTSELRDQWNEYFELLREQECAWNGRAFGVPFGSPVYVLYYRADLLQEAGIAPPKTWVEYLAAAKQLDEKAVAPSPTLEPVGRGWAALTLLARAAPYASHSQNYSVLFDIKTMTPLIDGPPFVRALTEMVETPGAWPSTATNAVEGDAPDGGASPTNPDSFDPATVRRLFWEGKSAMAITWPSAVGDEDFPTDAPSAEIGITYLPAAEQVYNVSRSEWESPASGDVSRAPLLAMRGRMGFIAADTELPEASLELLLWLSGRQYGVDVSSKSAATTIFRDDQRSRPGPWVERVMPPSARMDFVEVAKTEFNGRRCVFAMRIPGRDKYLESLDAAVQEALRGEATPEQALSKVANQWRAINEELGVDGQLKAYGKSLGIW